MLDKTDHLDFYHQGKPGARTLKVYDFQDLKRRLGPELLMDRRLPPRKVHSPMLPSDVIEKGIATENQSTFWAPDQGAFTTLTQWDSGFWVTAVCLISQILVGR